MPVRVIKHGDNSGHNRNEKEEEVFDNVQYLSGRLKDINEGGACLHTEMMAESGDLIKISSASPDILLPPPYRQCYQGEKEKGKGKHSPPSIPGVD